MLNGILACNKPPGLRSTESLNMIKRLLPKGTKIGHAGTLDSTAEGLLIVLLGKATRTSSYIMSLPKLYEVTLRLGRITDTDDYQGKILADSSFDHVNKSDINTAIFSFLGSRFQTPPDISAVRINGRRAHVVARSGEKVEASARLVQIRSIAITSDMDEKGQVSLEIACHKGTYIRSLVRDLGKALGCGASVARLERTRIGTFSIEHNKCFNLGKDEYFDPEVLRTCLMDLDVLEGNFLSYRMDANQEEMAGNGKNIALSSLERLSFGLVPSDSGILLKGKELFSFSSIASDLFPDTLSLHPDTNMFIPGEVK